MTEARYRGQKVVVVSPDYAEHTKFADHWLPAEPGTDGALAMAMGHVILKEFYVEREAPYFARLRAPLHRPAVPRHAARARRRLRRRPLPARLRPRRRRARTPSGRPVVSTRPPASRRCRTARSASAGARRARAAGTSTSASVDPALTLLGRHDEAVEVDAAALRRRRDRGRRRRCAAACPAMRVGGRLVTTVLDLAARPVRRRAATGLPGEWPAGYDDASAPYTPAWQEAITGVDAGSCARDRARVRPQRRASPRAAR